MQTEIIHQELKRAIERGQSALSEYRSKRLLECFGIPVTREILVRDPVNAVEAAEKMGWPVALKASTPDLLHTSDKGLIELNLRGKDDVRAAFDRIEALAGRDLEGILVQEMVPGQRELVLGLHRDPQFGLCVMLGLGGTLTEIFQDSVFRMAPVDRVEAEDMTRQFRAREILDEFRGQAPADIDGICDSLIALGRIGLEFDAITEIDVNPVIVRPTGRIVAVDAMVFLK